MYKSVGRINSFMALDASDQIEKFQEFFNLSYKKAIHTNLSKGWNFLIVDFFKLAEFDPRLADELLEEPNETVKAAEIGMEQFDVKGKFRVRFDNLPSSQRVNIRDTRSKHLGKFISYDGIIRQSSEVRPQAVSAKFECPSCGNNITMPQVDQQFREPTRCTCGRKGKFRLLSKELVDVQRLVIEESPETLEGGAQPKRLSVFLREDLVEPRMERRTTPGTRVIANGVVVEVPIITRTGGISTRFDLVMNANFLQAVEEDFSEIDLNKEDEAMIKELSKDPRIYEKLVESISPSIFGHEKVKEAILLQLFGGVRKIKREGTKVRGDMHILLVGDPGCGKSQLLTFVDLVAPKSRYVAGRSASGAGLTASVVKDEFLRGWALEAGAMVLADKGTLVLDEMDKISRDDTAALHEAMEQQQISIAKANIQATLRTQTSVLAAANPKFGRFDPFIPIPQQIDLPPALITRFDLIFPMRDLPDKDKDASIADKILGSHSYQDTDPEISKEVFRKYLAYTKQKIFPRLSQEAVEEIKNFYVNLRSSGQQGDQPVKAIPISARQIEAAIRLSEACAKIRLSDKVSKMDAIRAVSLLKGRLTELGMDPESGTIDIDRMTSGTTASTRNAIITVREVIFGLCEEKDGAVSIEDDVKPKVFAKGVTEAKLEEAVNKLKKSGDLFEPKRGWLQKI